MILATGNVLAPALSNVSFLEMDPARERVRKAIIHLICREPRNTNFYLLENNYNNIRANIQALPAAFADLGPDIIPTVEANAALTIAHTMAVLNQLVEHATPKLKAIGTSMYINIFVSLGKKGLITDRKADALNDAIRSELGIPDSMDKDLIHYTYTQIGSLVNELNAGDLFGQWKEAIEGFSLRLKMTLEQAAGTGLTPISIIKKAMKMFPTFDWGKMNQFYPGELQRVLDAAEAIGDNRYFGFKSSMGIVASANYKNLAYVAKELLHAHGGPDFSTVKQYQGWTRNPKFKAEVDALVAAFAQNAGAATDEDNDLKNATVAAL
jgi:hypothetical protein